jgi:hypothetical protein
MVTDKLRLLWKKKQDKIKMSNEFWSTDLYFAAFLQTSGLKLLRTERDPSNRVQFIFETNEGFTDLRSSWFAQTGMINGYQYANNIRNLKAVCHSGQK